MVREDLHDPHQYIDITTGPAGVFQHERLKGSCQQPSTLDSWYLREAKVGSHYVGRGGGGGRQVRCVEIDTQACCLMFVNPHVRTLIPHTYHTSCNIGSTLIWWTVIILCFPDLVLVANAWGHDLVDTLVNHFCVFNIGRPFRKLQVH